MTALPRYVSRYAREDQYPPGTDLRIAARDSVIRYCRHFGLRFRWLHDMRGEVWGNDGRPLPRRILAWRSDVEITGPACTCRRGADGPDTDGCRLHDLPLSGLLIGEETP